MLVRAARAKRQEGRPNGLYFYKARYYDPELGSFLQTEPCRAFSAFNRSPDRLIASRPAPKPIGYADQMSLYAYVGNDPVNATDPTGMAGQDMAGCATQECTYRPQADQRTMEGARQLGDQVKTGNDKIGAAAMLVSPGPEDAVLAAAALGVGAAKGAKFAADAADGLGDAARGADNASDAAREGIYEFPDQAAGGVPYVGQSGNIPARLGQHERAGRLTPGTETTTAVEGGRTSREVAEHNRIQELTGGQPARTSREVSNQRNPIGPRRRDLLDD